MYALIGGYIRELVVRSGLTVYLITNTSLPFYLNYCYTEDITRYSVIVLI